jgi:hypothetical protein
MAKKKNTKEFIEKARRIHGKRRYCYRLVNYINSYTKVSIICKQHGEFLQLPSNHLSGTGCPRCGREKVLKIVVESKATETKVRKFKARKYKPLDFDAILKSFKTTERTFNYYMLEAKKKLEELRCCK